MKFVEGPQPAMTKRGGARVGKAKPSSDVWHPIGQDPAAASMATFVSHVLGGGGALPGAGELPLPPPPAPAASSSDLLFGYPKKKVMIAGGAAAALVVVVMLMRKGKR